MSTAPPETQFSGKGKQSANNETESSNPLRKFWPGSKTTQSETNAEEIDSSNDKAKRKGNRLSRLFKTNKSSSPEDERSPESSQSASQKRRQQVYQAQKRHRNRQAEYVQSLESEVARLQHQDATVTAEKNVLAEQNRAIREYMAAQTFDLGLQLNATSFDDVVPGNESTSGSSSAMLDIRFDEDMGHERAFVDFTDFNDLTWTSEPSSTGESSLSVPHPVRRTPVKGDTWAALDFILALEWPCAGHVYHPAINPEAGKPEASESGEPHGHALTTTGRVFHSAQQRSGAPKLSELSTGVKDKWQLPHTEIDKLVRLSEQLPLDDEKITPAQAYAVIRESVPSDECLVPTLNALKVPLGALTQCGGFGAIMPTDLFYQHLNSTLETLQFKRPEVGSGESGLGQ